MTDKYLLRNITYAVVTLLVSGNLYFIKKLVDKVDMIESMMWQVRQEVVVLSVRMDNFKKNGG